MTLFDKFTLGIQVATAMFLAVADNFDSAIAMSLSSMWCAFYFFKSKN